MKPRIKSWQRIAQHRINRLFEIASKLSYKDKELANRYVKLARKISAKYKVRIPRKHKLRFCKYCGSYFFPGVNARIRTRNKFLVIYCKECKHYRKLGLAKKSTKRIKKHKK